VRLIYAEVLENLLSEDSRSALRRRIRLVVPTSGLRVGWSRALIRDLSETGLRIDTTSPLTEGETLLVELPIAGSVEARVVWKEGTTFGCEFSAPVSRAVVSAALLQGSVENAPSGGELSVEELIVGTKPGIEELTAWKVEFEQTSGSKGYQLLGFRQTEDGMVLAIVTRTH